MAYSKKPMKKKSSAKKAAVKKATAKYKKAVKTSKPGEGSRFKAMEGVLKAKGVKNPGALAASIGRKKYGAKRMANMAKAGRKK